MYWETTFEPAMTSVMSASDVSWCTFRWGTSGRAAGENDKVTRTTFKIPGAIHAFFRVVDANNVLIFAFLVLCCKYDILEDGSR